MNTKTKILIIVTGVIFALTVICAAAFATLFALHIENDVMEKSYDITVAGVEVTRNNKDDILGDGSVFYDDLNNVLVLNSAELRYDYTMIYARVDMMIELIGENKFIMSGDYVPVIYSSNYIVSKDLAIFGDGSLTIDFETASADAMGIHAKNLRVESNVTINMPDNNGIVNGIYCEESITVTGGATVTVNNGSGKYSTAVKACNSINVETGSALNVSLKGGTTDICKGLKAGGSLLIWDNAKVNVTVDDSATAVSECVNVAGLLSVGRDATLNVSSKNVYAIECYGSVELKDGATVTASREAEGADIYCYGAIVNYGASVNADTYAICGVHNK